MLVECAGSLACEHRELIQRLGDLFVQRDKRRAGIFHLCGLALHIRIARDALRASLLDQDEGLLFEFGRVVGQREALLLIAWEGLSVSEAAVVVGCSRGAFAVRLHRARRRLSVALAHTASGVLEVAR